MQTLFEPTQNKTVQNTVVPSSSLSLADMAAEAKQDRNRAVDLYRVVAMGAVALGHWAAIAIGVDNAGNLVTGNALESVPSLAWVSWLLQVMPLFFVVGGFSSAMSLDSHNSKGGRPQDWVVARLRRMLAPTAVLAATWVVLLIGGFAFGLGDLVLAGAVASAIPLWFLANYTIDTAIAPYVLGRFRRHPRLVAGLGLTVFLGLEGLRFIGTPVLPQFNWILGWLLFQVAGFAWRDGLLPTGARLLAYASGLWAMAIAAVTLGPYPVAMVHFPGIGDLSPTHPPSLALMLFGAAYSATALAAAPAVSRWLAKPSSKRSWSLVVAGNSVAMTVYLWHFTAAVGASAVLYALGWLPTAAVGTATWWIQKLPLIGLAMIILIAIVAAVARFEQRSLLAPRTPWAYGQVSMFVLAVVISTAVKAWAGGSPVAIVGGASVVVAVWQFVLKNGVGRRR